MINEFIYACFFIFIAEMGDKTQILAMSFATKYPAKKVLLGVVLGSLFNHAMAILIGFYLSKSISTTLLQLIAAFSFIVFGFWGLIQNDDEMDGDKTTDKYGPVLTVALAFFLGELGDKTQLTAVALASQSKFPLFVLMGTVLGMALTSGLAIWIGNKIGKKIPELVLKLVSSGIFFVFGIAKLLQFAPARFMTRYNIFGFSTILLAIFIYVLKPFIYRIKQGDTLLKTTAQELYLNTHRIQTALQNLCPEKNACCNCKNHECIFYFINSLLDDAQINNECIVKGDINIPPNGSLNYDRNELKKCLKITIDTCLNCQNHQDKCVGNIARQVLELQYFGKLLPFTGDKEAYHKIIESLDKDFFKN